MSRTAWHDLIDGDIEWLLEQPGGDERDHILETLRLLRRYGPPRPPAKPDYPPGPNYTEERVVELYERGYTGTEIAHRLRISQTRAYSILAKAGITRRRCGPRHGRGYKASR